MEKRMKDAAADLEFETAARLRDEVKRLRMTELTISDDPMARQRLVEDAAGAYAGERKYGDAGNMPARTAGDRGPRKPTLDEMTVGRTEVPVGRDAPIRDVPMRTMRTNDSDSGGAKKPVRGRAKKTGRPGM
jgi:excinuclease ABC subunit B